MNWLLNCPSYFKPHYYRWYFDDIFILFTPPEHLESLQNSVDGQLANMSFTIESEEQNRVSFLNVQIICEDKTSTTSVHRKPTFSGVYSHFDSFLPSTYNFGTVYTLAYKCFRICSSWTKLHTELLFVKQIFIKNGYPESFIDKCFRIFG